MNTRDVDDFNDEKSLLGGGASNKNATLRKNKNTSSMPHLNNSLLPDLKNYSSSKFAPKNNNNHY